MAQTPRSVPANYPQPLGMRILKAEGQRQASILRQEFAADLITVLTQSNEPDTRARLIRLIQSHLKMGIAAANRAEELWPDLEEAREAIEGKEGKPSVVRKNLKLFEQFDRVQGRSLALLQNSFENIQLILDRVQPSESPVTGGKE